MTNHPNRAKVSLSAWIDSNENQELCDIAGDIAYDALRGYFDARDIPCPVTNDCTKSQAADIAFAGRRGWDYAAIDANDPAGEIAKKVLAANGYRLLTGVIGFDATIALA